MDHTGIVATSVARRFGDVEAVRSMDLRAAPGEVTALVGPNGAGKTTLLLILATLLTPDSGQVRIAGHDPVAEPDAVRARLGWSPDAFGLYDGLTAREYLEFFGAAYRLPRGRAQERARALLELAHLEQYADQPVHVLSRGQKQRLGLMRALVHSPDVLVLDEPASGLDPRSRVDLRDLLRLLAAQGTAVLVSSHALADLEELAHVVVFVDAGRTVGEHRIDALPESAQPRPWRLRALDSETLEAALTRAKVPFAPVGNGAVDVELVGDEAAADLVGRLVRARVRLVSVAPVGGALEATFLELTEETR